MADSEGNITGSNHKSGDTVAIEIACLTKAANLMYGYDFHGFSISVLKRKILAFINKKQMDSISYLQHVILKDKALFLELVAELTINVTQMFRDADVYRTIRDRVLPRFSEYEFLKIWVAGCSSGEEAYSMAILLEELGWYDRTRIYATDISMPVLETAVQRIYEAGRMKENTQNYLKAGGSRAFSDYYTARYDRVRIDKTLQRNIKFAVHNLASEEGFGMMDIILCRNVFIYFKHDLQAKILRLFHRTLNTDGILCLGSGEGLMSLNQPDNYFEAVSSKCRIFRKAEAS
jgi:chemotaxis protein methyltransferase CheR